MRALQERAMKTHGQYISLKRGYMNKVGDVFLSDWSACHVNMKVCTNGRALMCQDTQLSQRS
jgi:hypothetical protein